MFGLSYWVLPAFAGTVWLGTLAAMLGWWINTGSKTYPFENPGQHIAYISDVGATKLRPLFIAGSATMVVVFDLAFISERWLRHRGRLAHNYSRREAFLSICATIAAIVGAVGLIILSIFDVKTYKKLHDSMLCVFIGGYVVSAIFICAEYQRLGIHFREYRHLRASFWIKLAFIFVEVGLVVGFGVESYRHRYNTAAILEWIIALVYIFYVWSFIIDFIPATHTRRKDNRFPAVRRGDDFDPEKTEADGNATGGPVYTNGGTNGYASHQPVAENGRSHTPLATNY